MRVTVNAILVGLICMVLVGCNESNQPPEPGPAPNPNAPVSRFNPLSHPLEIPFPNNLLFRGSMDGTIDAPVSRSNPDDLTVSLNKLGGFSTVASVYVDFDRPWPRARISPAPCGSSGLPRMEALPSGSNSAPPM